MQCKQLNVVLLGKTGSGKSASGNTILGKKAFVSKLRGQAITEIIKNDSVTEGNLSLKVYDTPGIFDPGRRNEDILNQWNNVLELEQSAPTVYLLVICPGRFTEEQKRTVEIIEMFLGESRLKNTWILFPRGDELEYEDMTVEEYIDETPELFTIVERFEDRYHLFNNKAMANREQVKQLMDKIQKAHVVTGRSSSPHQPTIKPERRLVLLGKTGVGKSASGNTILGADVFESELSAGSVTYMSKLEKAIVAGRQVSVVDTPGLLDTRLSPDELGAEMARSIYDSDPGAHALLIVLRVGRFTAQEKEVINFIRLLYGEKAAEYTVVLFTGGDELAGKTIENFIETNKDLSDLVQQCRKRYHVLNNKDKGNRDQVTALLDKIDRMVEENGGNYYTNEMFQHAVLERARQEADVERCKRAEGEKVKREQKERERQKEQQRQEEIESARKAAEDRFRKEYEDKINALKRQYEGMLAQSREQGQISEPEGQRSEPEGQRSGQEGAEGSKSLWERFMEWCIAVVNWLQAKTGWSKKQD